jgi:hypothetical protein
MYAVFMPPKIFEALMDFRDEFREQAKVRPLDDKERQSLAMLNLFDDIEPLPDDDE